jgi:magnesium chelatase family protein
MPLAKSLSVGLVGVEAHVLEVEVDVSNGLPGFTLSALSDRVFKHVEHRLRAAFQNSAERWPQRRITVALSPATVPKSGSSFDLAIAATMLAASEALPPERLRGLVLLGELSLGGAVKPVTGVLPSVIGALRHGRRQFVVPRGNAQEARLGHDADVFAVASLRELCAWLRGEIDDDELRVRDEDLPPVALPDCADMADVLGQDHGRRAAEISAAGGHHLMFIGSPGVGKTMLAERLPGILPALTGEEALEVTGIHSIAGRLRPGRPLIGHAPYCAPHHSATLPAVVGGGSGVAAPGAVSLAHRGVLFLDEAPEFHPRVLDALRQPLETGEITLSRAGGVATYPCRFLLVLAANQCKCAAGGRDVDSSGCICPPPVRDRYRARVSGPLRDRLDLVVTLGAVSRLVLTEGARAEPSARIRERVEAARDRARHRYRGTPWTTTGDVPGPALRRHWPVRGQVLAPVHEAVRAGSLSTRGIDRILKVAWTIADLAGRAAPDSDDIAEALVLRSGAQFSGRVVPVPA